MNQESIAAIQRAGQAIQDAHVALVHETNEYSALVLQALAGDAFDANNDARYEQWKAAARLAQTLQSIDEQLKQAYFAAGSIATSGGSGKSKSSRVLRLPAPSQPHAVDVVARPAQAEGRKAKLKSRRGKAKKGQISSGSARSAVSASGLKGNSGRVMDYLVTKLSKSDFVRLTHAEISQGAPVPLGSAGAAIAALTKAGLLEEAGRGNYRLL